MSENKAKATGEYGGVEFFVGPDWCFHVPSLKRHYGTYAQMTDAIDRIQAAEQKSKKRKMAVAVVRDDGKQYVITGVHAGHGHIVSKPAMDRAGYCTVYPDVAWIREAIDKQKRLRQHADHIKYALDEFRIDCSPHYRAEPGEHVSREEQIEQCAAKRLAAAEKTDLEKQLQATDAPNMDDMFD